MKKYMIIICCLFHLSAYAEQEMRPGLWKVSLKIKTEGQVIEPGKMIKQKLAELPKEERVKMVEVLEEELFMDENGKIRVCYGANNFKQNMESMSPDMNDECLSTFVDDSNSKIVSNFSCLDGVRGINTWIINNAKSYTGVMQLTGPEGDESEVIYEGRFDSDDCGSIEGRQEEQSDDKIDI